MTDHESYKSLFVKLAKAKKSIGAIAKKNKNSFFKSNYEDINEILEHIEPVLLENDLLIVQPIEDNRVITKLIDIDTGLSIESYLTLPEGLTNSQDIGGAITYYRRYTLKSLLALRAEDDDGDRVRQATSKPVNNKPKTDNDKKLAEKFNWSSGDALKIGRAQLKEEAAKTVKHLQRTNAKEEARSIVIEILVDNKVDDGQGKVGEGFYHTDWIKAISKLQSKQEEDPFSPAMDMEDIPTEN